MNKFCLAFCMSVLVSGVALAQQGESLSIKKSASDPKRFECDIGFATFTTPKGWSVNRSDKPTYAILTPEGEAHPKLTKMITIDAGKPTAKGPKATAEAMAKQFNGKVLDETLKVDGVEAHHVKCQADPKQLKPVECVVIANNDKVVMFIAGATKEDAAETAIKELVASWKWKK